MANHATDIWCNACEKELRYNTVTEIMWCQCRHCTKQAAHDEDIPEEWPILDVVAYFKEE